MRDDILDVLRTVIDPQSKRDIVTQDMVSSLQILGDGAVVLVIEVDPEHGSALEPMRQEAERKVALVSGVKKLSVILTAQAKTVQNGASTGSKKAHADPHNMNKNPPVDVPARHVIVMASGKGGVGKSTVAANVAAALAQKYKVGLLDADIYGPSQPVMMGNMAYKPQLNKQKKLIPALCHNIQVMSIGFIADQSKALVWRGPMVQTAFYQMLRDVAWGGDKGEKLDYLIIDLPPGTGDVQLTLAQKVRVGGAVIVSTPQDIALIDARRAVEMFAQTGVSVLGLVENMSMHVCSNCGHEEHIFGHGGAEKEAQMQGIPFLGALPLSLDVRECADGGTPIVIAKPESAAAKSFSDIVSNIINVLK